MFDGKGGRYLVKILLYRYHVTIESLRMYIVGKSPSLATTDRGADR